MSALKEAIKRVKLMKVKENTVAVNDAVMKGRRMSGRMFGIEQEARERVRRELIDLESNVRLAEYFSKYPRLHFDMSCLEWRDKNRLPKLVVFALDEPLFYMAGYRNESAETKPRLPATVWARYDDVLKLLQRRAERSKTRLGHFISAKFRGIIPEDARERIVEAQRHFDQVFIIAEPEKIEIGKCAPLPRDPLVVGWDGFNMWYICDFDTTSIEEAALLVGPANP